MTSVDRYVVLVVRIKLVLHLTLKLYVKLVRHLAINN
jgi:hypothetical protein